MRVAKDSWVYLPDLGLMRVWEAEVNRVFKEELSLRIHTMLGTKSVPCLENLGKEDLFQITTKEGYSISIGKGTTLFKLQGSEFVPTTLKVGEEVALCGAFRMGKLPIIKIGGSEFDDSTVGKVAGLLYSMDEKALLENFKQLEEYLGSLKKFFFETGFSHFLTRKDAFFAALPMLGMLKSEKDKMYAFKTQYISDVRSTLLFHGVKTITEDGVLFSKIEDYVAVESAEFTMKRLVFNTTINSIEEYSGDAYLLPKDTLKSVIVNSFVVA